MLQAEDSTTVVGSTGDASAAGGEDGDRRFGGNRWPRPETLALLKIRSDMDEIFRHTNVKGPLWDDVSRKMGELGYNRSAKKCKEKFENIYKYHKRTKENRGGKSEGKNYQFFEQLEAFRNHPSDQFPATKPPAVQTPATMPVSNPPVLSDITVPSIPNTQNFVLPEFMAMNSTSSSTSSDEELERRRRKKRKWEEFFDRLTKEVIAKQEELHNKFIAAIEKREHERKIFEENWRRQEISRINHESEILAQERSMAAAKNSAVIAFIQKVSQQNNPEKIPINSQSLVPAPSPVPEKNGGENIRSPVSSSRWPKDEVEALIKLRTNLDMKYEENVAKGPLWEEISAAMKRLGYDRSSKRCKEKWENINKYFRKVKESKKSRSENSKTCPYFDQLDAIYKGRSNVVPLMIQPEQQWPPEEKFRQDCAGEENGGSEEDEDEELVDSREVND